MIFIFAYHIDQILVQPQAVDIRSLHGGRTQQGSAWAIRLERFVLLLS